MIVGPIAFATGASASGDRLLAYCVFDFLAGERSGERLAYFAGTYN
jgi:hypothetical protein